MNRRTFKILLSLSLSMFLNAPIAARAANAMNDADLMLALQEAFMLHFKYSGTYKQTIDKGYGLGCKKDRNILMHWQSSLKDIEVSLSDAGIAEFKFDLEGSKAYLSYSGKDSLCMFKGYFGDVLTDHIRGEFHIIPRPGTHAAIDIRSLEVSNLKFVNWTLFDPFILDIQGDAPRFLNEWAQNSFNGLVRSFLKSSFSDRLDRFVSDKIESELKKRYDGGGAQFVQVQDSSSLVH